MGRWGVWLLVGSCVVGATACDHHSPRAAPVPGAPRFSSVSFPRLPAIEPGVLRDDGVVTGHRLSASAPTSPRGMRLTLASCTKRAPKNWVMRGRVVLPTGARLARAILSVAFGNGDLSHGVWTHRVTFTHSGQFAVALADVQIQDANRLLFDDHPDSCDTFLADASVPLVSPFAYVDASTVAAPFTYSAPHDSVQALGIGAPLRDWLDPRTISLYSVWEGQRTPITTVWVPVIKGHRPALAWVRMSRTKCSEIGVSAGPTDDDARTVTVWTRKCVPGDDGGRQLTDTHRPVAGAPGFTWSRPSYPDDPEIAVRVVGSTTIWVEGGSAVPAAQVARVAATLTIRRNLAR